ncbi:MAG: tRNA guanosine(34) transglycosylase Tgt, partial [Dehalococcoidia bacterium]
RDLVDLGVRMVLANTYHLYLRPGPETIRKLGGLHRFMAWEGPILTDSGGYQVFSLAPLRRVSDQGVTFRSHIDGSEHLFTPELAVELQEGLGADIIMALDVPSPFGAPREEVARDMERTHDWAVRCLASRAGDGQALFGIVQGGTFPELRRDSAEFLASLDFPGYALGGLCLGEPKELMMDMVEEGVAPLPPDRPRYLMGVGSPEDLVAAVARGIDLFDSALPTRVARNGALFTRRGRVNIRKASFREREGPIDAACDCSTCRTFSAAYLHHLFRAGELLGLRLATVHNLRFIMVLMEEMRQSLRDGVFEKFRRDFLSSYIPADESARLAQKRAKKHS